jgi:ABC-type transport system substrate-binding protein
MIVSIRSSRKLVVFALVALAIPLGACGGDDEDEPPAGATTTEQTVEQTTDSEPTTTDVNPETETLPNDGDGNGVDTGESGEGGAGDEQPAETLALFTGENGKITPAVVRVPAFIAVRVELRSADGAEYGVTFEGETIKVRAGLGSVSTTIDGLRPGEKLVGTPIGASGKVRIEATAEPGP